MSGKYRGFFDVLTGFVLGASTVKIYYESISTDEDAESSFTFRQNKKKIDEICTTHENLKIGKSERQIGRQTGGKVEEVMPYDVFKYGRPHGSQKVLHYKNHVLAYDTARRVPLWVAEHLTNEKFTAVDVHAERMKSSFQPDPNIPAIFQAKNEDYYKSGWTRGHMAPAGNTLITLS